MMIAHMETDYKYYVLRITKDLLNDVVLVCNYGSKHNRYANQQIIGIESLQQGCKVALQKIKLRYQHGYKAVFLSPYLKQTHKEKHEPKLRQS